MTSFPECPGEKWPFWAVAIWHRCGICKFCFQSEHQLIRHREEKHSEEIKRLRDISSLKVKVDMQADIHSSDSDIDDLDNNRLENLEQRRSYEDAPSPIDRFKSEEGCASSDTSTETVLVPSVSEERRLQETLEVVALSEQVEEDSPESSPSPDVEPAELTSDDEMSDEHNRSNSVQKIKHNAGQFVCRICLREFKLKAGLGRHMSTCHSLDKSSLCKFSCTICKKKFLSQYSMETHVQSCRKPFNSRKVTSRRRSFQSPKISDVQKSMATKITSKLNSTKRISTTRSKKQGLSSTSVVKSPAPTRQSPRKDSYNDQMLPTSHKRTSLFRTGTTSKAIHQCNLCPKILGSKQSLNVHLRTHAGKKSFECKRCNLHYSTKRVLTTHLIDKHSKIRNYR